MILTQHLSNHLNSQLEKSVFWRKCSRYLPEKQESYEINQESNVNTFYICTFNTEVALEAGGKYCLVLSKVPSNVFLFTRMLLLIVKKS